MKLWFNNVVDAHRHVYEITGDCVRIGRASDNDVVLDSPFVAERAAVIRRDGQSWSVLALGDNGIHVREQRIAAGQQTSIQGGDFMEMFPFSLALQLDEADVETSQQRHQRLEKAATDLIGRLHLRLLEETDLEMDSGTQRLQDDEYLLSVERSLEELLDEDQAGHEEHDHELLMHVAGQGVRDALLEEFSGGKEKQEDALTHLLCGDRHWSRIATAVPQREQELQGMCRVVERSMELSDDDSIAQRVDKLDECFWDAWSEIAPQIHSQFVRYLALRNLKKEIKNIVFGYGPLEDLLRLPVVSEIMVVDREHIFVERGGVLHDSGRRFVSDAAIESIIQRIVSRVGRRIDKSQPLVDARLKDGSRVNAVIAPIAVSGPCLTVRKFPADKLCIADLIEKGSMSSTLAQFLRGIVMSHRNVVVSGGTGTGKTTLLNCLSDFIPGEERVVTVEDTAELRLAGDHVVRLETKDANVEGKGEYTIRDLVKNALRMRPDRIVVGECRGAEALDMLQAMNTGHDGSLTTVHANNARDAMLRLEVLVQTAADLPLDSIRRQIAAAVDVVVQLTRLPDGRRCVTQVAEILDVNHRTGQIEIRELFRLPEIHAAGETANSTGALPTFIEALVEGGHFPLEAFYQDELEPTAAIQEAQPC